MAQHDLIFSTILYPGTSVETDVILLCESIRQFAGALRHVPIWCFIPGTEKEVTPTISDRLHTLNVTCTAFSPEQNTLRFPFAGDIQAAALAETRAHSQGNILVWLSANTLVLQEPKDFCMAKNKLLGYRPVHHTLIGSRYEEPLDTFWTQVYTRCEVPPDRIFPMNTHVDNTTIRPYFNAGMLVTRPHERLLQSWSRMFFHIYQDDAFRELYREDKRYVIFMHQAVLSAVVLSRYMPEQLQELPPTYNYPLHLYNEDVTPDRPAALEELITVRHEGFYKDPEWSRKMPAGTELKIWLETMMAKDINL